MEHSFLFLAIAIPACLAIVVYSASIFLRGAVSVAHKFNLPEFLVGSVIVAVGTSAPEVAINVSATLEGAGDIVVSNIIGSNIVNVALGIGIAGFMLSFDRARREYTRTLVVGLIGTMAVLANTLLVTDGNGTSYASFWFSSALLIAFAVFMYNSIKTSTNDVDEEDHGPDLGLGMAICFIIAGAVSMAVFSDFTVNMAVDLAHQLHIPEAVVGATIIAAGGSLPEVSSCIAAARLKRPNLVLGNIVGSQIFNILGILGLSGIIKSFTYSTQLSVDIGILIAMTLLVMACILIAPIRKLMGPLLVLSYLGYAGYLIAIST